MIYSETWIPWTAGDHKKSLSYEKFELWVMLSLCISHVATALVCSISWLNFLKFVKFSNLVALTTVYQFGLWLKVPEVPSKVSLARQGPWNSVWVEQVFRVIRVALHLDIGPDKQYILIVIRPLTDVVLVALAGLYEEQFGFGVKTSRALLRKWQETVMYCYR